VKPGANKSVLIVDEDRDVLGFLTLLFEYRKLRVLRARTRAEAAEILGRQNVPVHAVLANMMAARIDAADFAREVAGIRPGLPVVYMSAFVDSGVIRIEAMRPTATHDERGVLEAVLSAVEPRGAGASGG
jgi:DNA-binding NtrC family response regulator